MPRRYIICYVCCCALTLSRAPLKTHHHGQRNSNVQMEFKKWLQYLFTSFFLLTILHVVRCYLEKQRQQRKQALNIEDRVRTPQELLHEYKTNAGHKYLTRSERRFRERLLEKYLQKTWSQDRSRSHSKGTEPVRRHPAVKEFSRMNRQLRQPSPPESRIWHQLHLLFNELCIYTALPFLTFSILCHHLRINLTESLLLEHEEDSDDGECWELDPV